MEREQEGLVGRRVQIVDGNYRGEIATVVLIDKSDSTIGVKFEGFNPNRCSLGGRIKEGFDWWLEEGEYILEYKGFRIGDEVVVIDNDNFQNIKGRVVYFDIEGSESDIGVEFEKYVVGHSCYGYAKEGYGSWFNYKEIILIEEMKCKSRKDMDKDSRVVITKGMFKGEVGTIIFIDEDDCPLYAVELDEYYEECHDCEGNIDYGYGYWFNREELEEIREYDDRYKAVIFDTPNYRTHYMKSMKSNKKIKQKNKNEYETVSIF